MRMRPIVLSRGRRWLAIDHKGTAYASGRFPPPAVEAWQHFEELSEPIQVRVTVDQNFEPIRGFWDQLIDQMEERLDLNYMKAHPLPPLADPRQQANFEAAKAELTQILMNKYGQHG